MSMKITKEEISSLLGSFNDLVELKVLIRAISPTYELDEIATQMFTKSLNRLKKNLSPLFSKYLITESKSNTSTDITTTGMTELLKLRNEVSYILVSSSSLKKKLKKMEFDPRRVIATGGPIFPEDHMKLNPNLNEENYLNIKKKYKYNLRLLKKIDWSTNKLYFICEVENQVEDLIRKSIKNLSLIINAKIDVITIPSWKILTS